MPLSRPAPVLKRSKGDQVKIAINAAVFLIGSLLRIVAENSDQIKAHWIGVKWLGDGLFIASLAWAFMQKTFDTSNITHAPQVPKPASTPESAIPLDRRVPLLADPAPEADPAPDADADEDKIHE